MKYDSDTLTLLQTNILSLPLYYLIRLDCYSMKKGKIVLTSHELK